MSVAHVLRMICPECVRFLGRMKHMNSWSTHEVCCTGTVQLKGECIVVICQSHLGQLGVKDVSRDNWAVQ